MKKTFFFVLVSLIVCTVTSCGLPSNVLIGTDISNIVVSIYNQPQYIKFDFITDDIDYYNKIGFYKKNGFQISYRVTTSDSSPASGNRVLFFNSIGTIDITTVLDPNISTYDFSLKFYDNAADTKLDFLGPNGFTKNSVSINFSDIEPITKDTDAYIHLFIKYYVEDFDGYDDTSFLYLGSLDVRLFQD